MKNAAEYAGIYTSPDGKKLEFAAEGEKLILVHGGRRSRSSAGAGGDRFIVKHPDFETFLLGFVRENRASNAGGLRPDWYMGTKYTGAKTFETKKDWEAFVGHYKTTAPGTVIRASCCARASSSSMVFSRSFREVMESLVSAIRKRLIGSVSSRLSMDERCD